MNDGIFLKISPVPHNTFMGESNMLILLDEAQFGLFKRLVAITPLGGGFSIV